MLAAAKSENENLKLVLDGSTDGNGELVVADQCTSIKSLITTPPIAFTQQPNETVLETHHKGGNGDKEQTHLLPQVRLEDDSALVSFIIQVFPVTKRL